MKLNDVLDCEEMSTCDLCAATESSILGIQCSWNPSENRCASIKIDWRGKWETATKEFCSSLPKPKIPKASLKPRDWLLSEREMKRSREGIQRENNIKTWTEGNEVKFLQTGKDVFEDMYDAVKKTKDGDKVVLSQWCFGPETLPFEATKPDESQMGKVFGAAVKRGVDAKFLLWRNTVNAVREDADTYQRVFQDTIKEAADSCPAASKCKDSKVVIDGRNPGKSGSIHQKFGVISNGDKNIGYIGGIDMNYARWDTVKHGTSELRDQYVRDPDDEEGKGGWIDRHIRTIGPASIDLANSFIERWNSKIPMDIKGSWVLDALSLAAGPEIEIVDENPKGTELWEHSDESGDGTAAVQILRTYPCGFEMISTFAKHRWEFARLGELSYLRGFEKAVLRAREYIYIEDQYGLFQNGIFRSIARALEGGLKHLVVLLAKDSGVHLAGCAASQYNMWMPFKNAYPDRVHLLLRKDDAFVHSKMMIVDDVYALIGSANIGRRSFTSDPEIGAAVVDTDIVTRQDGSKVKVAKFAYHTRVKSWAEMTGVDASDDYFKKSLSEQIKMFSSEAASGVDDVKALPLKKGTTTGSAVADFEVCEMFDPEGLCTEEDLEEEKGVFGWFSSIFGEADHFFYW